MTQSGEPRPKLLIVEDDEDTAYTLKALFHHGEGWGVVVAFTLADGRALLQEECPDAILVDLNLPDGCGEDLIEQAHDRCPRCRVVVVTGEHSETRLAAIQALQPYRIIHKPYYIEDLTDAVKGVTPSSSCP